MFSLLDRNRGSIEAQFRLAWFHMRCLTRMSGSMGSKLNVMAWHDMA